MGRRDVALRYFDENRAFMKEVVEENINRYRKGDGFIFVTDKDGTPLSNVEVSVRQQKHAFKHGANVFMLDEMETAEKNENYKTAFKEIFNLATIPFYWNTLEPEQGKPRYEISSPKIYRRPAIDLCMQYCLDNGIEPKMHCLNYDKFRPDWAKNLDVDAHKQALEKRFNELSERYAGVIPSWEVTNETFEPYVNEMSAFYDSDDFVEWSFLTADKYFPNNQLLINDYCALDCYYFRGNRSPYYMQIERLLKGGVTHLDCIGMQFHSFFKMSDEEVAAKTRYNPIFLYKVLDQYASLGKAIQITEMTIPAYSESEEDENVQAELMENLYRVFFSHPAMNGVIYWNLTDGYAGGAQIGDMTKGENVYYGGLMRFDGSKKKAYDVIQRLFYEEWRTNCSLVTDKDGKTSVNGFYGEYELEINHNGKRITKHVSLLPSKENVYKIVL